METAFEIAADLGYDGVEVMVWTDPVSQQPERVRELSHKYGVDVLSVHSPCLLITQRVWGTEPWGKIRKSVHAATLLGAGTVVIHPPFRWQRTYAANFERGVRDIEDSTGITIAVENMFPLYVGKRQVDSYAPGWDVTKQNHRNYTLDTSHTSVSGSDAMQFARTMGARLRHVHIADGTGLSKDEHLIPGRGQQPCAELLETLAKQDFDGAIVVEVSTRQVKSALERNTDLAEALAFTRLHFAAPPQNNLSL